MGTLHSAAVGSLNHALTANPNSSGTSYATIAARDADTSFNTDSTNLNKLVRIESPLSFYILVSVVPAWLEFTSTSNDEWTELGDTPSSISANLLTKGNSAGTALEFTAISSSDGLDLTVPGDLNLSTAASVYKIGGSTVLDVDVTLFNVLVGDDAGAAITTAFGVTAVGHDALANSLTGSDNTAIGFKALFSTLGGDHNTAVGSGALQLNTTGSNNEALGSLALQDNTTGDDNTAVGTSALLLNMTGADNVGIGATALRANVLGRRNVAIGSGAGLNLVSATLTGENTLIGYGTGLGITTGVQNTILGANVIGLSATLSNNIILADGAGAVRLQFDSSGDGVIGGGLQVTGALLDTSGDAGTSGQVLSSTVTGTNWIAAVGNVLTSDTLDSLTMIVGAGSESIQAVDAAATTANISVDSGFQMIQITPAVDGHIAYRLLDNTGTLKAEFLYEDDLDTAGFFSASPFTFSINSSLSFNALTAMDFVSSTGVFAFKTSTNSLTAWQVQNSSSVAVVSVDTINLNFGVGVAVPLIKLHVQEATEDEQFRLGYDAANYIAFTASSTGDLAIDPTGGDTIVGGSLRVTGVFNDSSGDAGTSGQILSSTVTGTNWIDNDLGDVLSTGTPVDNQVAVWTDATTIEGDAGFTWNGLTSTLAIDTAISTTLNVTTSGTARIASVIATNDLSQVAAFQMLGSAVGGTFAGVTQASLCKIVTDGANLVFGTASSAPILFITNSSEHVTLTVAGFLGIGEMSPSVKLHVVDTVEQFRLGYDVSNYAAFTVSSAGDLTIAPTGSDTSITGDLQVTGDLVVDTNTLFVDATSNRVGIGTAINLGAYLNFPGDGGAVSPIPNVITIGSDGHGFGSTGTTMNLQTEGNFRFYELVTATPTERFTILSGGNVGVSAATPLAKLHVIGTTEQLRLGFDGSNFASFTVSSSGDLTLAPSGGDLAITASASVSANLAVTGTFADSSGDVGTAGQVLSSTVTGTNWISPTVGTVLSTGTPVNNQLAVWVDADTIEGDIDLTFNGSSLAIGGSTALTDLTIFQSATALNKGLTLSGPGLISGSQTTDGVTLVVGENVTGAMTLLIAQHSDLTTSSDNAIKITLGGAVPSIGAGKIGTAIHHPMNIGSNTVVTGIGFPSTATVADIDNAGARLHIRDEGGVQLALSTGGANAVGFLVDSSGDLRVVADGGNTSFPGNLGVTGTFADSSGDVGTSGQVLSSTATGTNWIDEVGDVASTGTPLDNQLAVWTGANTIEGTTSLTFSGNTLRVGRSLTEFADLIINPGGDLILNISGNVTTLKNSVDATTGFRLATAASVTYLVGDSVNERIGIGMGLFAPDTTLHILSSGADTTAVLTVETTGANAGEFKTFVGSRNPSANVTGAGGDLYVRDNAAISNLFFSKEATTGTGWKTASLNNPEVHEIFSTAEYEDLGSGGVITTSELTTTLDFKTDILTATSLVISDATHELQFLDQSETKSIIYIGSATYIVSTVGGDLTCRNSTFVSGVAVSQFLDYLGDGRIPAIDVLTFSESSTIFGYNLGTVGRLSTAERGPIFNINEGSALINLTSGLEVDAVSIFGLQSVYIDQETETGIGEAVVTITDSSYKPGRATFVTLVGSLFSGESLVKVDAGLPDTYRVNVFNTNLVLNGTAAIFDVSGSTNTFSAVADNSISSTTITSVRTNGSGVASFGHSGTLAVAGSQVTTSAFTTNTSYNTTGLIAAVSVDAVDVVTVTTPGTGYLDGESVTLVGVTSLASNATAVVTAPSTSVTSVTMVFSGSGYISGEVVTIVGAVVGESSASGTITINTRFEVDYISFVVDEASVGSFLVDAVTVTATAHGLATGIGVTLDTTLSTAYDGGYLIYNVTTNSFDIQSSFSATQAGGWSTEGLDQTDPRVLASSNPGIQNSEVIAFGFTNNNIAATTITDGTYTNIDASTFTENEVAERFKLTNATTALFELTSLEDFAGFLTGSLTAVKSGSTASYRFAMSTNGAAPTFATANHVPMEVKTTAVNIALEFSVILSKGETIQIMVAGDGTSDNLTITDLVFGIK